MNYCNCPNCLTVNCPEGKRVAELEAQLANASPMQWDITPHGALVAERDALREQLAECIEAAAKIIESEYRKAPSDLIGADRSKMTGLEWLTEKVNEGHGSIVFAQTEDGQVGVFYDNERLNRCAIGSGDTAEEALDDACANAPIDKVRAMESDDIRSTDLICSRCGVKGATTYRQNTSYQNDASNWVTLCPSCKEDNDAHWRERWDEYYANCM